ncbi:MAG TPA: FecR domain-containing protein, partial [Dongiaceae bacterium]|nr:FecR domain-containing protein [Dongiaceae bacterium]
MVELVADGNAREGGSSENGPAAHQLAQAATGAPIGEVRELAGTVQLVRADGTTETAAVGTPVYLDDSVITGPDGSVEIVFIDDMTFSLGANAQVVLDNLVYNPGGDGNAVDLSVVKGAFVFITGGIASADGEGVIIDTPAGTLGIRGTAGGGTPAASWVFSLFADPDGSVGRIVITNAAGQVVLDRALQTTAIVDRSALPSRTYQLTDAEAEALFGDPLQLIQQLQDLNPETPEQRGELDINPEAGEEALATAIASLAEILDAFAAASLSDLVTNSDDALGGGEAGPAADRSPSAGALSTSTDDSPPAGPLATSAGTGLQAPDFFPVPVAPPPSLAPDSASTVEDSTVPITGDVFSNDAG